MTIAAALASLAPQQSVLFGRLAAADVRRLTDLLGEGEVSFRLAEGPEGGWAREAVFPGLWLVQMAGDWSVDCRAVPAVVERLLAAGASLPAEPPLPDGVMNGPALLREIALAVADGHDKTLNLTALPLNEADHRLLDAALGTGPASAEVAGYGACRVQATAVRRVWRVRYFNADDRLLVDAIEIADLPVAVAAQPEDVADGLAGLARLLAQLGETDHVDG